MKTRNGETLVKGPSFRVLFYFFGCDLTVQEGIYLNIYMSQAKFSLELPIVSIIMSSKALRESYR